VDPVRELAKLGDGSAQLGLGLVEAPRELLILIGSKLPAQKAQREREPDQTLLSPVVEVALEPAPLDVARFDDASTGGAEILELRAHLGLEALVLEGEASRRGDFFDELRILEQARSVYENGDRPTVANERRHATTRHPRDLYRTPFRVHVTPFAHRIDDLELGIRKRSGKPVAQTARGSRLAELDDEPGERRARAASA
jgi:hypothetical protein